jgi:uncharacterized protein (UPF0335 family)
LNVALLEGFGRYSRQFQGRTHDDDWEMKKKEQLEPAEAADKLLSIVREIKELDEQNDTVNRRKAGLFKSARTFGFTPAAIKEIARPTHPDQVDTDVKILRQCLRLVCGDEASGLLKSVDDFGRILFGADDGWPSEYTDPRLSGAPE